MEAAKVRPALAVANSARLSPGTRVRLRAPAAGIALRANTGTIVRLDAWGDYYIVRLDKPAIYDHGTGQPEELHEIAELAENMNLLTPSSHVRVRLPGGRTMRPPVPALVAALRGRRRLPLYRRRLTATSRYRTISL